MKKILLMVVVAVMATSALAQIPDNVKEVLRKCDEKMESYKSAAGVQIEGTVKMKVSIISYIRGKKVMAAHALIQNGMKPNEAATAMGFTEYSTFYRDYRQLLGGSPSKTKSSR